MSMNDRVRVLVIDDSAYNRRTIIKILEEIPGVEVAGYACDGEEGLRKLIDIQPDLVTLDLEMPRLDGFSFLRIAMQTRPTPVVVVSSRADDANVFKALELGAVEFVAKPSARVSPELFNIRDDLVRKIEGVARTDMQKILRRPSLNKPSSQESQPGKIGSAPVRAPNNQIQQVVIAASTGGPPALQAVVSAFQSQLPIGIAIAQHMPPGFTKAFADRLNQFTAFEVREAQNGDVMAPGRVLICPGGKNLIFEKRQGEVIAHVVNPPEDQRYIPSADVMFASASEVFKDKLVGVVLTGMGNDGAKGVVQIKENGGQVIAESEETSVVYGMPKEAVATGRVDRVVPLNQVCREILKRCGY